MPPSGPGAAGSGGRRCLLRPGSGGGGRKGCPQVPKADGKGARTRGGRLTVLLAHRLITRPPGSSCSTDSRAAQGEAGAPGGSGLATWRARGPRPSSPQARRSSRAALPGAGAGYRAPARPTARGRPARAPLLPAAALASANVSSTLTTCREQGGRGSGRWPPAAMSGGERLLLGASLLRHLGATDGGGRAGKYSAKVGTRCASARGSTARYPSLAAAAAARWATWRRLVCPLAPSSGSLKCGPVPTAQSTVEQASRPAWCCARAHLRSRRRNDADVPGSCLLPCQHAECPWSASLALSDLSRRWQQGAGKCTAASGTATRRSSLHSRRPTPAESACSPAPSLAECDPAKRPPAHMLLQAAQSGVRMLKLPGPQSSAT